MTHAICSICLALIVLSVLDQSEMAVGMIIFLSICVIVLSFWIRRSYFYFLRSIFGSIERLPFPVQEGVREGWEIYHGKEHYCCVEHVTVMNF